MDAFTLYTADTVNGTAADTLAGISEKLGFLPNVFAAMAGSAPALAGFVALNRHFAEASLSPLEREIVQTVISATNQSAYCVAGHTAFSDLQDLDSAAIEAVRRGQPINDAKLQALRLFASQMLARKGQLPAAELTAFLEAGYSHDQVFEVILGIALKVISNLASNVAQLDLDVPFAPYAWTLPEAVKQVA
ncbi:MAG: carboxymuconolactone decarboxylase family protein [Alphaproteobacteria bacterium]|nr:carboxymuconolactone decarboxylase family protein [Alphaproteobacteria bacterium]